MPPKRRNPRLAPDEKASITKAARELAKEINAEVDEAKAKAKAARSPELVRQRQKLQARRRKARRGTEEKKTCAGTTVTGRPCQQVPLIPELWDGDEKITGLYCLHHEPNIQRDQRESFLRFGTSRQKVPRRVTPGEVAHDLIQRAPAHFLRPYLKALGLRLTDEGELEQVGTGLKLHGYSRGGEVIRSRYPDYVGQVNITEKLLDRIYGKARQSVDLASMSTTVQVNIEMDPERISKVSQVLTDAGIFPNGNGNGNGHHELPEATDDVIEGTAVDEES